MDFGGTLICNRSSVSRDYAYAVVGVRTAVTKDNQSLTVMVPVMPVPSGRPCTLQ